MNILVKKLDLTEDNLLNEVFKHFKNKTEVNIEIPKIIQAFKDKEYTYHYNNSYKFKFGETNKIKRKKYKETTNPFYKIYKSKKHTVHCNFKSQLIIVDDTLSFRVNIV